MKSFEEIGIPAWLREALHAMRITTPTPIQAATIPEILKGRDCIGGAKTGSGKTIAFAAPMLTKWAEDPCGIFGIVLTPTRELAMQIAEQFTALGANINLRVELVIGGESMIEQSNRIKENPDFVIATPGRLAHIMMEHPDDVRGLKRVKYLVLDEADRLLTDTFGEDLATCMNSLPEPTKRQTLLFTATVTDSVRSLKDKHVEDGKQPVFIYELDKMDDVIIPEKLYLGFMLTPFMVKEAMLHDLLTGEDYADASCIVFVNRSETAETLRRILFKLDIKVTSLHSQLPQQERTNSLQRFRAGAARVLVTTDLGSRGLDIPIVKLVINYDIPRDPDDFIHRVGRTARAGRKGDAISLVTPNDIKRIMAIEKRIDRKMEEYKKITDNQLIKKSLKAVSKAKVEARMDMERDGFNTRTKLRKRRLELERDYEEGAEKHVKKSDKIHRV